MVRARITAWISVGLLFTVLLACKKKPGDAQPSATAAAPAPPPSAAAPAPAPAPTPAPAAAPKLGDVKRYGVEKEEKLDGAGVRVTADEAKVFNEGDTKTPEVATLPKGLLVFRLVKMETFSLVEFPSGVAQFSQGWVETSALSDQAEKVTREGALTEKKVATVKVGDAGAPAPKSSASAAASASAAPKASASAAPKASATSAPKASSTAPPKGTVTPRGSGSGRTRTRPASSG